jgi:hypothetical protein
MSWRRREPRLTEMLADPIIQAVMAADGVDSNQLSSCLEKTRVKLNRQSHDAELNEADNLVGVCPMG